ncbi:hypothetical protein C8J56DRAFT_1059283 [Mycena floridula]|nr:hypothetical protein C8J56DRAFT_1059283 [Mycena floridula]
MDMSYSPATFCFAESRELRKSVTGFTWPIFATVDVGGLSPVHGLKGTTGSGMDISYSYGDTINPALLLLDQEIPPPTPETVEAPEYSPVEEAFPSSLFTFDYRSSPVPLDSSRSPSPLYSPPRTFAALPQSKLGRPHTASNPVTVEQKAPQRGRPCKASVKSLAPSSKASSAVEPPLKRKRGRPFKTVAVEVTVEAEASCARTRECKRLALCDPDENDSDDDSDEYRLSDDEGATVADRPTKKQKTKGKKVKCSACQSNFTRAADMRRHWESQHGGVKEKCQCRFCGKMYSRPDAKLRHENSKVCHS